jgi:hypothetical protein
MQVIALLIDQEFRVTDNIDEKDMGDLKFDPLGNLARHGAHCRGLAAKPPHHSFGEEEGSISLGAVVAQGPKYW